MKSRLVPISIAALLLLLAVGVFLYFQQNNESKNSSSEPGRPVSTRGVVDRRQISVFITNQSSTASLGERLATVLHEHGYITSLATAQPGTASGARKTTEIIADDLNLPQAKMLQLDLGAGMIVRSNTGGFLSSVTLNAGDDINLEKLPLLHIVAK